MNWTTVSKLSHSKFQRLVGVKRPTFIKMVEVVNSSRTTKRGRPSSLCTEDKVLMLLMFYREYRTYFHIAMSYNISEVQCWRIIRDMENKLVKSKIFHLPGKKALLENTFEVIVVDVGESPIERPKKNSENIIQAKRKDIH